MVRASCCFGCDREGCAEGCNRFCPCIAMYPSLCTSFVLLLTSAVFAVCFGAYTFISLRTSIFRFDWSSLWYAIVNSSLLAIIISGVLITISLLLWVVCATPKKGILYKLFILVLMLVAILALAAVMVGSIFVIYGAKNEKSAFSRELEDVWIRVVSDPGSTVACRIQKQLNCRGLERGDCVQDSKTANFSLCATVCRPEDADGGEAEFTRLIFPGCRERVANFLLRWNAVLLAGTSVAFILVLIAFFITSTSISFQSDK